MATAAANFGQNPGELDTNIREAQEYLNRINNELSQLRNRVSKYYSEISSVIARAKANLSESKAKQVEEAVAATPFDKEFRVTPEQPAKTDADKVLEQRTEQINNVLLTGNPFALMRMKRLQFRQRDESRREFHNMTRVFKDSLKTYAGGKVKEGALITGGFALRAGTKPLRWTGSKITGAVSQEQKDKLKRFYNRRVVVRFAKARRDLRKKKEEGGNLGLTQFALKAVFTSVKDAIVLGVKTVVKGATVIRDATTNLVRESGVGKALVNSETYKNVAATVSDFRENNAAYKFVSTAVSKVIPDQLAEAGRTLYRVGEEVATPVVRVATASGKLAYRVAVPVAKTALEAYKLGGAAASSFPKAALVGLALGATSGNLAVGLTSFGVSQVASTYSRYRMSKFLNPDGTPISLTKLDDKLKTFVTENKVANVFTGRQMAFRAIDTGMTVAGIGAVLATALGVNPLLGAAIGFGAGSIGRYFIDRTIGRSIASAISAEAEGTLAASKGFSWLAHVPAMAIINRGFANQWLLGQIDTLKNKYNWNVGKFLQENYSFAQGINLMSMINVGGNYLGAISYFQATNALVQSFPKLAAPINQFTKNTITALGLEKGVGASAMEASSSLAKLGRFGFETLKAGGRALVSSVTNFANPVSVGAFTGSILGFAAGALLSLGVGPGALIAAGIGSVVGASIGVAVGGALAGGVTALTEGIPILGQLATPITYFVSTTIFTAVFQTIGQAIGSLFDRGMDTLTNGLYGGAMAMVNAAGAILNLANLATEGITVDNVIPMMMSLMAIANLIVRSGERSGQNTPSRQQDQGSQSAASSQIIQKLELANYHVDLVGTDGQWTQKNVRNLIQALDDLKQPIADHYNGKQIYIAMNIEHNYQYNNLVILSLNQADLEKGHIVISQKLEQIFASKLETNDDLSGKIVSLN